MSRKRQEKVVYLRIRKTRRTMPRTQTVSSRKL
uniref:Uncharacterized protein n=1 Tax=Anopheles albimanus TaxID=7167 RepID=A0A182FYF8_ANOAL